MIPERHQGVQLFTRHVWSSMRLKVQKFTARVSDPRICIRRATPEESNKSTSAASYLLTFISVKCPPSAPETCIVLFISGGFDRFRIYARVTDSLICTGTQIAYLPSNLQVVEECGGDMQLDRVCAEILTVAVDLPNAELC
jgi:hypothetical protein